MCQPGENANSTREGNRIRAIPDGRGNWDAGAATGIQIIAQ
jgi:hypothetical protein